MSLIGASAIAAGSAIASGALSATASAKLNKRTIKYNKEMYNLQRQHALEDWERKNQYDSPQAQMQRLKDAGLNPHLVYGNGADATSGSINAPSALGANLKAEDYSSMASGVGESLSTYYSLKQQQANIAKTNAETQNIQGKTYEQEFMNQILDKDWATAIRTAKAMAIGEQQQNILGKSIDTELKRQMMGNDSNQRYVIRDLASDMVGSVRDISVEGTTGRNLYTEKQIKEIEKIGFEISHLASGTDLRKQQARMNELEIQFNRSLGLPAGTPWYAQYVMRILKVKFGIDIMSTPLKNQ